jgi:signal transduction histidine kinase
MAGRRDFRRVENFDSIDSREKPQLIETKNMSEPVGGNASDIALSPLAPVTDWRAMAGTEHFVQFYEADASLLDSLSGFIGAGLAAEDACLVVATPAHREALDGRLQASGLDVAAARARGQYVALDAAETLSKFMSAEGQPDPQRFVESVGALIARVAEGRGRVRIFGEMVALLWAEGNCPAAIRLEELWNQLHQTRSFTLFCAYPLEGFGGQLHAAGLNDVCTSHSRVIPAESYTALANPDERLRHIIALQQKARTLEAEIAERKEAEERLRVSLVQEQLARAEAEQASRLKDEFLATASHELRTPLTAILGWAHMLRQGKLSAAETARAIETIERNARSQAQLVEDILDVSRVITGKLRLKMEAVDVASVINAAIDAVQLAAESKNIQLQVTLDASARHLSGDAGRLQQVVWNLLSNAIKFTPAGGRVEVRLEREGAHAQLKVSDTGCGFDSDFLPYIFDRFRQADGSSTRRHGGLGLGLSIVRHLVELHGGTVTAESAGAGAGATFTIELPLTFARHKARKVDAGEPYSWRTEEALLHSDSEM